MKQIIDNIQTQRKLCTNGIATTMMNLNAYFSITHRSFPPSIEMQQQ